MTQQIGRAYRKNRRVSILLAGLVVLVAVVAIPLASGAADKTYTLAPAAQAVCTGGSATVSLSLTNTAKTVSLGSADITIPGTVQVTGVTAKKGTTTLPSSSAYASGNKISLRNLSLAKNGVVTLTVGVSVPGQANSTNAITAIVKQSNDFNDSNGGANVFSNPSTWPTLQVKNCFGTIEGKVWNDKNESRTRPVADEAFEPLQEDWQIKLYEVGSTTTLKASVTTNALGAYKIENVPLGKAYVVCEEKPSGDSHEWGQTTPTAETAACVANGHEPNGIELGTFTASVIDKDFGNVETASLGCNEQASSNPEFAVQSGDGDNCKDGTSSTDYVYEKWSEGTQQYAAFHPVTGDGACELGSTTPGSCTYFVQRVVWTFTTDQQPDPAGRSLKYDDVRDQTDGYQYEAMKFCKQDPRDGTDFGLPPLGTPAAVAEDVLPDGTREIDGDLHSTCLITSTESADTEGTITRTDFVFTAVDGRFASP